MGFADKAQYGQSASSTTRPSSGGQAKKSFGGKSKGKSKLPPLTHSVKSKESNTYVASIFASEMTAADGTAQINLNIKEPVATGTLYVSTKKGLISNVITDERYDVGNPTHSLYVVKEDGTAGQYVKDVAIWQSYNEKFDTSSLKVVVNAEIPAGKYAIRLVR